MSESSGIITCNLVPIDTSTLTIKIAIPPENPKIKGYFKADYVIKSKPEVKAIFERVERGEIEEDETLLRELFSAFHGLGNEKHYLDGEDAWDEVIKGANSSYLVPACIQAYFEQYGLARQGNSAKRR